ncbi:hypothetical protein [Pandoravirus japonicus]|uniref:F-box domain-containing protein n=1 Tax=Pandoravirus japonicus TaxID=2823154 RepID=A0A811BRK4_9VIRU|nr:hypothetical protein [Pandoravirus japonicus]
MASASMYPLAARTPSTRLTPVEDDSEHPSLSLSTGLHDMPPELVQAIVRRLGHPRDLGSAQIAWRPFADATRERLSRIAVRWGSRHPARLLASGAPCGIVRAALAATTVPLGPWLLRHAAAGGRLDCMRHLCGILVVCVCSFCPFSFCACCPGPFFFSCAALFLFVCHGGSVVC